MADRYKFTVKFQGHGFGPSESWYSGDSTAEQIVNTLNVYLALRANMLFPDCEIAGVRVGRSSLSATPSNGKDPLRRSQFYPPGNYNFERTGQVLHVPGPGVYSPSSDSIREAFANVAVETRIIYDTARSATRYIVWPPQNVITADKAGGILAAEPKWLALYTRLMNFIMNKPGAADVGGPLYIKAKVGSTPDNTHAILGWVLEAAAPGRIGFVLSTADAAGMTDGQAVFIHGVRRKAPPTKGGAIKLQSINGTWLVAYQLSSTPRTGLTTVFLQFTEGIDPTTIKLPGTAQLRQYALFPVQNAYMVRVRSHRRGKDTTVPAGRRTTRTSADP